MVALGLGPIGWLLKSASCMPISIFLTTCRRIVIVLDCTASSFVLHMCAKERSQVHAYACYITNTSAHDAMSTRHGIVLDM